MNNVETRATPADSRVEGSSSTLVEDKTASKGSDSGTIPVVRTAQGSLEPQTGADKEPDPVADEDEEGAALPKVVRNGKVYRKTKATAPFLKKHTWPEAEVKKSDSKDQHKDKVPKMGKESSPPVYERTTEVSRSLLRYAVVLVLGTLLLSRAMTESWTFGYEGRYTNVMNWIPRPMKSFTESELQMYDGSDSALPIYLALDGSVYDVSSNARMYGKGGSYNHFAGKDAARAFVTGCFKSHLTHDVRGFSEKEEKALEGWKKFFTNHAKYYQVGRVVHDPIAPSAPLPEPCDPKAEGGAR